jgi:hypothetical protein
MATLHLYNDFPGAFFAHAWEYTRFWAGLINDSVSVTDTASYRYTYPGPPLDSANDLPAARWQRSGNILTLVSQDTYFSPVEHRADRFRITHIGLFMVDESHKKSAGIGFIEKSWDFRTPAEGGQGGLRLKFNSSGILKIELTHG